MQPPTLLDPGRCTCRAPGKMQWRSTKGRFTFWAVCTRPEHGIRTPECDTQEEAVERFRWGRSAA